MTRISIRTQIILAAFVAIVVAAVVYWPASRSSAFTVEGSSTDYAVRVSLSRPSPDTDDAELTVRRLDGGPVDLDKVWVESNMPSMGHIMPALTAQPSGPGKYSVHGSMFLMAGPWQLSVRLHGAHGDETVTVPISVAA